MPRPLGLRIEGARQNNLKNITLEIPHDRLTVVTGVSGSGKSSLAFDTIFAEGQWRYIESLSTYARMFLDRVDRPDVDRIEQIRPAVALEQKNPVRTARSTVGTATEVYDYLRLLYAKIGRVHCPTCGVEAVSHAPESIVDALLAEPAGARAFIGFRVPVPAGVVPTELWAALTRRGFARVRVGDEVVDLAAPPPAGLELAREVVVVLDRVTLDPAQRRRLTESVEAALREGSGRLEVDVVGRGRLAFAESLTCPRCGLVLERPQPLLFSFNHPLGACPECKGFGNVLKYDETLVVPDPTRSLAEGAVEPWTYPSGRSYQRQLLKAAQRHGLDTGKPYEALTAVERHLVFEGDGKFPGIQGFFEEVEAYRYKLHVRVFLSRYRSQSPCPICAGARLKPAALAVRVAGLTIAEFTALTIEQAARVVGGLRLSAWETSVAREILKQLTGKLTFLLRVGLGYLTLARQTRTLAGGEAQRINLANQLGSQLVGTHPHWAVECTQAYIRAGYHISQAEALMVRDLNKDVVVDPSPDGYRIIDVARCAEYDADAFGYLAFYRGEEIAHCYARLYPNLKNPVGGSVGQIGDVGTAEAHRNKGLARVMTQMCLWKLKALGATEVLISTGLDNAPALRAYERAGFERRHHACEWTRTLMP